MIGTMSVGRQMSIDFSDSDRSEGEVEYSDGFGKPEANPNPDELQDKNSAEGKDKFNPKEFAKISSKSQMDEVAKMCMKIHKVVSSNQRRISRMDQSRGFQMRDIVAKFSEYDDDNSGSIDKDELSAALNDMGVALSAGEYNLLWKKLCPPDSDDITVQDFCFLVQKSQEAFPGIDLDDLIRLMVENMIEEVHSLLGDDSSNSGPFDVWDTHRFAPFSNWPKDDQCWDTFIMAMHMTMEDESYSPLAFCWFCVIMFLILISTVAGVMESVPAYEDWAGWIAIEYIVSIAFSVEFALRLIACRNAWRFWETDTWYMYDVLNVVDILAILPFYLEMMVTGGSVEVVRVIRVARLVRIARLRNFKGMQENMEIVRKTMSRSYEESFTIVAVLIVLESLLCSSFVYVAEKGSAFEGCPSSRVECVTEPFDRVCKWTGSSCDGVPVREDNNPSPFKSIPLTMWWTLQTMTTVGYGDFAPTGTWGMLFGSFTMLTGVVVVSIFVVVIAGNFERAQSQVQAKRQLSKNKRGAEPGALDDPGSGNNSGDSNDRQGSSPSDSQRGLKDSREPGLLPAGGGRNTVTTITNINMTTNITHNITNITHKKSGHPFSGVRAPATDNVSANTAYKDANKGMTLVLPRVVSDDSEFKNGKVLFDRETSQL